MSAVTPRLPPGTFARFTPTVDQSMFGGLMIVLSWLAGDGDGVPTYRVLHLPSGCDLEAFGDELIAYGDRPASGRHRRVRRGTCGHRRVVHAHYRPSSDCGACSCPSYRRARAAAPRCSR